MVVTAKEYFSGVTNLHCFVVDLDALGDRVKWEAVATRNGEEFPHLYGGPLPMDAVIEIRKL